MMYRMYSKCMAQQELKGLGSTGTEKLRNSATCSFHKQAVQLDLLCILLCGHQSCIHVQGRLTMATGMCYVMRVFMCKVCEALSGMNDPDEAQLLRGNVLEEISGKELQLATDAASSTLMEQVSSPRYCLSCLFCSG